MRIRAHLCACSVVNPAEIYHESAVVPERYPVSREIMSLCSLIQSHIKTRLLVLIASALFDHRQPCSRCCTGVIYVLYKDTLFLLCTFCVVDICVFTLHCFFVALRRPVYYPMCVSLSCVHEYLVGYTFVCACVCMCAFSWPR